MTRTTSRLLRAYAPEEVWKRDHERVRSCFDLEDTLAWGISLFRGLVEMDARHQERLIRRDSNLVDQNVENMTYMYQAWVMASDYYLGKAREFVALDDTVEYLEEFEATLEEARCMIGNFALEDAIPPIEELSAEARPGNPDPTRYGD